MLATMVFPPTQFQSRLHALSDEAVLPKKLLRSDGRARRSMQSCQGVQPRYYEEHIASHWEERIHVAETETDVYGIFGKRTRFVTKPYSLLEC